MLDIDLPTEKSQNTACEETGLDDDDATAAAGSGARVHVAGPSIIILDSVDDDEGEPPLPTITATFDTQDGHQQLDATNDPLYTYTESAVAGVFESYCRASDSWIVRIFGVLAVFLHLRLHLGVRACNLLLTVIKAILIQLGHLATHDAMPVTVQTTMKRFGIEDRFTIFPMCPTCFRIYNSNSSSDRKCDICFEPLFIKQTHGPLNVLTWLQNTAGENNDSGDSGPKLAIPVAPLSSLLAEFLAHDGIEEAVERWGLQDRNDNVMNDIMDGEIWKSLKGEDNHPFLSTNLPGNELRLGFTLSLDW